MSKKKILTMEEVVNNIWTNCCVRSTTTQKAYIEAVIKRLILQIVNEYKNINCGMSYDQIGRQIETLKMFDKYLF